MNELHNIDKYRAFNIVTVVADNTELSFCDSATGSPYLEMVIGDEDIRDGATFGDIGIPLGFVAEARIAKMNVYGKCSLFMAFDDPATIDLRENGVVPVLQKILDFVSVTVVPAFDPFFN